MDSTTPEQASEDNLNREELIAELNDYETELKSGDINEKHYLSSKINICNSLIQNVDEYIERKAGKKGNVDLEYIRQIIIENGSISEEFLVKRMNECEYMLASAEVKDSPKLIDDNHESNARDSLKSVNYCGNKSENTTMIDKFKTWIEIAKTREASEKQSISQVRTVISKRLRIHEIAKNNYSIEVPKSETKYEYNLEAINQYNDLFDNFVEDIDEKTEIVGELINSCIYVDDIVWITPGNNYSKEPINKVMSFTLASFHKNNPGWKKTTVFIQRCYANCIMQLKIFDEQLKNSIDIDGYNLCERIIKALKNMAMQILYAKNEYWSYNKSFYERVLNSIKAVKVGVDYILDLRAVDISCNARIAMLKSEEFPYKLSYREIIYDYHCEFNSFDSYDNSYRVNDDIEISSNLIKKCADGINNNKTHIMKAIAHIETLKCDMKNIHKSVNDYFMLHLSKNFLEHLFFY